MHVLITGATGFVGRSLCRHLAADGHQITAVSRTPVRVKERVPEVTAAIDWEGLQKPGALDGVDAVVHLAGETVTGRWNAKKHQQVRDSRVAGTRLVVDAIRRSEHAPEVLVSASGIGFYGEGGETELNEDAAVGDDYFAQVCADWEAEAAKVGDSGCRVVMARLGIVVGLGGGAIGSMLLPAKLGLNGPLGSGRQWWSWIHLDDCVGALAYALTTPELNGPVNIVAPESTRQADFARAMGVALNRPSVLPAPAFALRMILGTFATEILSSKRVRSRKLTESGFVHRFPDVGTALQDVLGESSRMSLLLPAVAAGTLGMAPYSPEPHIVGKMAWLIGGAQGMATVDIFDLFMHATPWLWLSAVVLLRLGAAWTARGR